MSESTQIDTDAWHAHAQWWDDESQQAPQRMANDPGLATQAKAAFGKIGGPAHTQYTEVLAQRDAAGTRLGDYASRVAAQIRTSVDQYTDAEAANTRKLTT